MGSSAEAAANNTINFQARVLTSAGAVVPDGNYSVQFKMYDVVSGGTALWTETHNPVVVKSGYVSVSLGSITAFPATIKWDQELWLTMNINSDGEMNPRMKVTSVPFAQAAAKLQQTSGLLTSTLSLVSPTGGNQVFQVENQGAAGTYTLCIQNSSACGFAPSFGSSNYIQQQNSIQQTANFWISGIGRADTAIQSPLINGSSIANGTLVLQGNSASSGNTLTNANIQFMVGDNGGTTAMTILNNGRVGIGTANPSAKLQVNGDSFVGSSFNGISIGDVSAQRIAIGYKNSALQTGLVQAQIVADTSLLTIASRDTAAGAISFNTGTGVAERLRISNNGNVGIGTTSPSSLLSVGSTSQFQVNSSGAIAAVTGITSSGAYSQSGTSANTFTGATTFSAAGTALSVTNNATVGGSLGVTGNSTLTGAVTISTLGTTNTSAYLCRNSSNQIAGCSTTGTGAAFVQGGNSFGANALLGTNDNFGLDFETNGVTRWSITNAGILQSNGAQTIQTSTGNLTIATAAGNGNIAVTPNGTGSVNLTVGASSLVNVLTGNLKVGDGTPGIALNGEDAYIEGTLEVDGNTDLGGTLTLGSDVILSRGAANRLDLSTGDSLNLVNGNLQIGATTVISSGRAIQNATGITSSGTITLSGLTADRLVATTTGGQLTDTITSSNLLASVSGTTGTGNLVFSDSPTFSGTLTAAAANFSGNISQSGATTFSTGTGAVSLNGNTSITGSNTLTVGTGATSLGGSLTVSGDSTFNNDVTVVGDIASAGTKWTSRNSAANNQWRSVTYGNGLFVAVANSGTGNRVMTSPDGINWTARNVPVDNPWSSVTYGNGLFVAVSESGSLSNQVMTSPDGITWTSRTSAANNQWRSVTYGNGLFVAVANSGTGNRVMTSSNGILWIARSSATDNEWSSITYGNGLFVAVATTGTGNRVMTSPDGITWTSRTSAANNEWRSVTYGNGLFVAVATTGTGNRVMTSPDGITWTIRSSANDNNWLSVTYGNGLFVAVANSGTGNRVMTSPDGINWTARSSAADNEWWGIGYGNGLFVATSTTGTDNRVMSSGKNLIAQSQPNNIYQGGMKVFGGSQFVSDEANALVVQNVTDGVNTAVNILSVNAQSKTVGIGTNSPSAQLEIIPTQSSYIGQIIRGISGQTGDLMQVISDNNSKLFTIKANGNIGIGTTSPSALLSVGSTSQFQVNSSGAIAAATGITSSGTITLSALTVDRLVVTTTGGQLTNNITSSNLLASVTGTTGTDNLVFSDSPTFTTSIRTPVIYGSTSANGTLVLQGNSASSGNTLTNANIQLKVGDSSTTALTILNNTNVGIRTTSPSSQLQINISPENAGKGLTLSGTSLYPNTDNTGGPTFVLTYNAASNRQLTLFDSSQVGDSTKFGFRYIVGAGLPIIDAVNGTAATLGNFNLATGVGRVGIGFPFSAVQSDVGALLHINNTVTNRVATIIKGASGQTSDLLQIQNSAGGILSEFDSAGKLGVNTTSTASALTVKGTSSLATIKSTNAITADGTFATNNGWTVGTGWDLSSGEASHTTGNTDILSGTTTATSTSDVYQITFTVTQTTAGSGFSVTLGGMGSGVTINTAGTKTLYIAPTNNTGTLTFTPLGTGTWVGTIDDVVVSQVLVSTADMAIQGHNGTASPIQIRQGGSNLLNVFIGDSSGSYNISGQANTAVGRYALQFNTTGTSNTAVGLHALRFNTTGTLNTAIGREALSFNSYGGSNTALGYRALYLNTSGNNNIAVGLQALQSTNSGSNNVAVGSLALSANTTGSSNVAIGYASQWSGTTASANSALGYASLYNNLTGSYNVALGSNAGRFFATSSLLTNPNTSVFLGYNTRASADGNTNEIVIGFEALGNGSNSVTLGNTSITKTVLQGSIGIGTTSPSALLSVGSTSQFQVNSSGAIAAATGITSSGTITLSGLTADRLVATTTGGQLTNTITSSNLLASVSGTTGTGNLVFSDSPNLTGTLAANSANFNGDITVVGDISNVGTKWALRTSAANNEWLSVAYGNGLFVAVAKTGSGNRVMTSPDGINWTTRSPAADLEWTSVTYGNGLFVAVAQTGANDARVMISSNGINWTTMPSSNGFTWRSVTYGNGTFVAVSSSSNGVMVSKDGRSWKSHSGAANNSWVSVTYGNGLFVAVAYSGSGNRVMTSPDGETWTARTSAADNSWWSVTYGNGLFVAVANSGSGNRVMTSPDGITWTARTSAADNNWNAVTYGDGLFVAVAESGSGNRVMTSPDGITWTARTSAADNSWHGVTYANGMFVAVGYSGSGNRVMTSGKPNSVQNNQEGLFLNNVGIGNRSPNYLLHVGSNEVNYGTPTGTSVAQFTNLGGTCTITPSTAGGITCTSDIRNKKNIDEYDSRLALGKILGLSTISYNMNNDPEGYLKKVGFSAQDLESVLPDLVVTDPDGYKSISYSGLTPYLVSAIQEQQSQINDAKSRLAELEDNVQPATSILDLTNGGTIKGTLNVVGTLNVTGSVAFMDLTVTSNVSIGGNLAVKDITAGNITINGKIITSGDKPTITVGLQAGVADTQNNIAEPTVSVEGNDTSGTITIIPGKNTEAGEIAKIDFAADFSSKPRIVISPANKDSAKVGAYYDVSKVTNSGFSIFVDQAMETGKIYSFTYFIVQ